MVKPTFCCFQKSISGSCRLTYGCESCRLSLLPDPSVLAPCQQRTTEIAASAKAANLKGVVTGPQSGCTAFRHLPNYRRSGRYRRRSPRQAHPCRYHHSRSLATLKAPFLRGSASSCAQRVFETHDEKRRKR